MALKKTQVADAKLVELLAEANAPPPREGVEPLTALATANVVASMRALLSGR